MDIRGTIRAEYIKLQRHFREGEICFVVNKGIGGGFLRVAICAVDLDKLVAVEAHKNQRNPSEDDLLTPHIIVQENKQNP